jgi:uncharacterized protein
VAASTTSSVSDVLTPLVLFGHQVRNAGIPLGPAHIRSFCEAAAELPALDLYWAGRATLIWRAEHVRVYDEIFRSYFGQDVPSMTEPTAEPDQQRVAVAPGVRNHPDASEELPTGTQVGSASTAEVLQEKSFEECGPEEWRELAGLMTSLPELLPRRRTRRYHTGRPGRVDVRRVARAAAETGGEPLVLPRRRRVTEPRPLVFLIDISGSMSDFSRGQLLFAHAVLGCAPDTEAFTFGTRLTRVTPSLGDASVDNALRASAAAVADWDGGTMIGEALADFLRTRRHVASLRRSVVLICSDGLDTGDPELLAEQAGRLRRSVHRVVWLNPLKSDPRYEPLSRGMRAALPHVDHFSSGHSIASLRQVLRDVTADR